MKTESIFIAFCLIFVPACKEQRSETPKWVVLSAGGVLNDGSTPSQGSYISDSEYATGTTLNFLVQNEGKLSALIVTKAPSDPQHHFFDMIGALGPAREKYSVEFKAVSNLQVTLHQASRVMVYAYAHLSAQDSPTGHETDEWILNGDGLPITEGTKTTFKWEHGVSVTMNVASSAGGRSSSRSGAARIAELENELNKLKGSQGSAPSTAGTLTREVAAKLVAPSYPRSLDRVCFSDQGLQRAQADGLLVKKTVMSLMTVYEFTDKAKQLFGPQIPESISRDERGQLCLSIPALSEQFEAITVA